MAQTPVVPLAGWPELRSASRTGRDAEEPVCDQVPRQEAATRAVRRRWSDSRVPIGSRLLWGMALLSLLLLPTDYRAGAEAPHGHSLIQLWVDASDGRVDHHVAREFFASGPVPSTSWFDPAVGETKDIRSTVLADERPDIAAQHESAPVSGGMDLLVTAMAAVAILGMNEVPRALSDRTCTGLPARILVPPPRWTATT
jgi:hypothetical protein